MFFYFAKSLETAVKKALASMDNPEEVLEESAESGSHKNAEEASGETNPVDALSPHELAIREFLENDEPLPPASLDAIVGRFWREEPYRSRGFILEGFPRTTEDVEYLQNGDLYFDFAIAMNADVDDVVPRLLPGRLAKWKVKMAKIDANKRLELEWNKRKRTRIREERRKILIRKINAKRMAQYVSVSSCQLERLHFGI